MIRSSGSRTVTLARSFTAIASHLGRGGGLHIVLFAKGFLTLDSQLPKVADINMDRLRAEKVLMKQNEHVTVGMGVELGRIGRLAELVVWVLVVRIGCIVGGSAGNGGRVVVDLERMPEQASSFKRLSSPTSTYIDERGPSRGSDVGTKVGAKMLTRAGGASGRKLSELTLGKSHAAHRLDLGHLAEPF